MPALPSVPGVLRIDRFFKLDEDLRAKVHAFLKYFGGPPTDAELNTMAAAVRAAFNTYLAPLMTPEFQMIQTIITDLTSPTAAVGEDATLVDGTRSGGALPADVCLLNSLQVARRFRGGHGRQYWPFGAQSDLHDAQTWSSAFVTACNSGLVNDLAAIIAAANVWASSSEAVVVSYYSGFTVHTGVTGRARNVSTPRAVPLVDPVTAGIARAGIASQRKRLLRLA